MYARKISLLNFSILPEKLIITLANLLITLHIITPLNNPYQWQQTTTVQTSGRIVWHYWGIQIRPLIADSRRDWNREIMPWFRVGNPCMRGCVPGKGSASAAVGVSLDEPGTQEYPLSVTLLLHVTDLFSTSSLP